MADGLLGGFSDFLLGGGKYADPNAINPQYGVPESDVRQAGINTLANVSALLLAAGQPMTGAQRAQVLAQLGPAFGGMNTDLYKAAQTRLMTAQNRSAQEELAELDVMRKKKAEDPEGLAKAMGVNVDLVKAMSTKSLVDMAKQITIKRATVEPGQAAITEAFARVAGGAPAAPAAAPAAAPTEGAPVAAAPMQPTAEVAAPTTGAAIYSSAAIPAGTAPQDVVTIRAYQQALNDPRIASNPESVKKITEALDRLMPGVREGAIKRAQKQVETAEAQPKVRLQIQAADQQTNLVTNTIDDALKSIESGGRLVAGTVGSRLAGAYEPATDLRGQIDTIKAAIGMGKIQEMKAQSATGATGFGQLAIRELDRIEAAVGSLDQAQSPDELKKRLGIIKDAMGKYNQALRQGYKATYKEEYQPLPGAPEGATQAAPAAPAATVAPAGAPQRVTREQYNALPSGALFLDPNGQLRRKP